VNTDLIPYDRVKRRALISESVLTVQACLSRPVRWRETASTGVNVSQGAVEGGPKATHGRGEETGRGPFSQMSPDPTESAALVNARL